MALDVHKVALETRRPSREDYWLALKSCLKADFKGAKERLRREQWLVSYDAAGKKLFGIAGSENMAVFVHHDKMSAEPDAGSLLAFEPGPMAAQKPVTVRRVPVKFKSG